MKHSPCHAAPWQRFGPAVDHSLTLLLPLLLVACSSGPLTNTPREAVPPHAAAPASPPPVSAAPLRLPAEASHAVVVAPLPAPPPPDAVPRVERIRQGPPNLPYVVRGDAYEPFADDVPMLETGLASWYGEPFHGRRTANGEVYDMNAMTAAHRTMPLPSYAVVRNRRNGKQIVVRVNDRGPYKYQGRVIDLSRAAARKLGFTGLANVEVRRLTHAEIRTGAWKLPPKERVASADPTR